MSSRPASLGSRVAAPPASTRRVAGFTRTELLVSAGVAMFILYILMDVVASLAYDGYSYRDQTISELSAFDAPTRGFWMALSPLYNILTFVFAFGVLEMGKESRRIRLAGWLLLASAVTGLLWWIAPMHQREVLAADGGTWQDTMHLVVGGLNSLVFFLVIGVGAFAFGRGFRLYSFATFAAMLVFGTLMSMQAPALADNEPTRWLGIWERIAVEGALLWMAVFAVMLIRSARQSPLPGAIRRL